MPFTTETNNEFRLLFPLMKSRLEQYRNLLESFESNTGREAGSKEVREMIERADRLWQAVNQ